MPCIPCSEFHIFGVLYGKLVEAYKGKKSGNNTISIEDAEKEVLNAYQNLELQLGKKGMIGMKTNLLELISREHPEVFESFKEKLK